MLISEEGNFHSIRLPHDAQVRRISWVVGSVGWPRTCGFLVLQPDQSTPFETPLRKRRRFRLFRSFQVQAPEKRKERKSAKKKRRPCGRRSSIEESGDLT
ncbi:hypothetical protein DA102_005090 [Sinorhizobium meliloti]|nr:hypothetical protein DA102_005090 [Sinorhizobium meliloti]